MVSLEQWRQAIGLRQPKTVQDEQTRSRSKDGWTEFDVGDPYFPCKSNAWNEKTSGLHPCELPQWRGKTAARTHAPAPLIDQISNKESSSAESEEDSDKRSFSSDLFDESEMSSLLKPKSKRRVP